MAANQTRQQTASACEKTPAWLRFRRHGRNRATLFDGTDSDPCRRLRPVAQFWTLWHMGRLGSSGDYVGLARMDDFGPVRLDEHP